MSHQQGHKDRWTLYTKYVVMTHKSELLYKTIQLMVFIIRLHFINEKTNNYSN